MSVIDDFEAPVSPPTPAGREEIERIWSGLTGVEYTAPFEPPTASSTPTNGATRPTQENGAARPHTPQAYTAPHVTEDGPALRAIERSLLSAVLQDAPTGQEVLDELHAIQPDAWTCNLHRQVAGIIVDLTFEGIHPGIANVATRVYQREPDMSAADVADITSERPTQDPQGHAQIIRDRFRARDLSRRLRNASELATRIPPAELSGLISSLSDNLDDADTPASTDPLPVVDLESDWATEDLPRREFALGTAAPLGAVTLLSAMGGAGKSTLLLQAAMGLACGRELVPGWKPSESGRVLFVALEDEALEIRRRMNRVAHAFELSNYETAQIARNLVIVPLLRPDFFRTTATHSIEPGLHLKALQRMMGDEKYRLCVIDPVAALLAGCLEENNNEVAQKVVGLLASVLPASTALILATHTSKAERETAASPRGAGAWSDAARQAWGMRPVTPAEAKDLPYGVLPSDVIVLSAAKSNYTALSKPVFLARLHDRCAGVLRFLDVAAASATRAKSEAEALEAAILSVLMVHDCTAGELSGKHGTREGISRGANVRALIADAADQKVTARSIGVVIKQMLSDGKLTDELDPRTGRKILIPPPRGTWGQGRDTDIVPPRDTGTTTPYGGLSRPVPESDEGDLLYE